MAQRQTGTEEGQGHLADGPDAHDSGRQARCPQGKPSGQAPDTDKLPDIPPRLMRVARERMPGGSVMCIQSPWGVPH